MTGPLWLAWLALALCFDRPCRWKRLVFIQRKRPPIAADAAAPDDGRYLIENDLTSFASFPCLSRPRQ
jgi:hypothetical protein